jgi:RNA polymerase sigma-70 factor (ECF subfamily)
VVNGVDPDVRAGGGGTRDSRRYATERLAARCQRGDVSACEELLEAYRPYVYMLVRAMGRDPDWVEDTVVEVLVQLSRSLRSFRWNSSFRTWVYSVTTKVCAAELRRTSRTAARTAQLDEASPGADDPVHMAVKRDEQEQALSMVARLPENYRVAVVLRHVMGCSYPELAEILDVPLGTAKTRVFMGMQRIRRMTKEGDAGGTA